ncbi:MAG: hypothetical protein AAGE84_03935 [Cyanobacteria bacterium P01_G01_bin.39]
MKWYSPHRRMYARQDGNHNFYIDNIVFHETIMLNGAVYYWSYLKHLLIRHLEQWQ